MLLHPGAASIDCEDCRRRLYDLDTGKPKSYRSGPDRRERFYDGPTHKPQCELPEELGGGCPKESPRRAKEIELNASRIATLNLYERSRATGGRCLTDAESSDPLLLAAFASIDQIFAVADRKRLADEIAGSLLPLLVKVRL